MRPLNRWIVQTQQAAWALTSHKGCHNYVNPTQYLVSGLFFKSPQPYHSAFPQFPTQRHPISDCDQVMQSRDQAGGIRIRLVLLVWMFGNLGADLSRLPGFLCGIVSLESFLKRAEFWLKIRSFRQRIHINFLILFDGSKSHTANNIFSAHTLGQSRKISAPQNIEGLPAKYKMVNITTCTWGARRSTWPRGVELI